MGSLNLVWQPISEKENSKSKPVELHLKTDFESNPAWFGLVSLFNGISTFVGYLMPKPFSYKNSSGTI